ncbi:unnamed protein product [Closterium sp. NIES-64]|nr:unnamed protein product [Closterium sp. NIES-64]
MVADSSDNNPKSNGGAEKKKERTAGQFFDIGEQEEKGEQGDASAKVGAQLHPLDYWVLDTGAAWTMTPRKDLLDHVRAAPINEVCSASGHALKVAGAGRAAFKGADGKPVVLHDVLLVPDLNANLISFRKLGKAGVSTSTDGARTYKGQLGNRMLWDLHESKDVHRSMWQLPALAWHGEGLAGEGSGSQGGCNAVGGVGVKVLARSGETDWATAHRRLGHVVMPLLKLLEKDGDVKELVHMDLVGPRPVQGHKGEQNRVLTKVGDDSWVPLERWLGRKPPVDMLRVFGYIAVAHVPKTYHSDGMETSGSTSGAAKSEGREQQQGKTKKLKGVVMRGWETTVSRPGRTCMATKKLTAGADVEEQQHGTEEALLILPHGYDPDDKDELAYCFLAPAPEEPASMEEALAGPDREKWLVSRDAEYQSLLENGTWDLVVLPDGKKAPRGYEDGTGRVCKLKMSIYGLKQAPRCWYQKLAAVLEEMEFRTSSCDESLFLKGEAEKVVLFLVYVDDIFLFSSSMKEIQKVQQQLMENFKCKNLGEVKYYLGLHVERDLDHRWLKLCQEKFIKEQGEKYGIENERKVATPLPAEFKLVKAAEDEGVEAEKQQQFQSLVGSLLHAAVHTRPDISFSVGQLARVVQNPSQEQVDTAERLVKYLNSHPSIGVQYSASAQVKQKGVEVLREKGEWLGEGKLFLTCFTVATWASEKENSSSVGGYICVVGGGPVSWRSKKQTETALSFVESEYRAMFHGVKEVIWLRRLLEEIDQEQKVATPLFCDSKGALGMARNAVLHGLNKHMRNKWHWLRKQVKRGMVNPIYIKTHHQPTDFLTKRLANEPHWRMCA